MLLFFALFVLTLGYAFSDEAGRLSYEQAYWRAREHYEFNALPFTAPPRNEPEPAIAPSRIHPDIRPHNTRVTHARARGYPPGYTSSNRWHHGYSYGERIIQGAQPWEDRNQVDNGGIRQAVRHTGVGVQRTPGGLQGLQQHTGNAHRFDHDAVRPGQTGAFGRARGFPV